MHNIIIEKNPGKERLQELHVSEWGIWSKEVSSFPWHYEEKETCYFIEGEVMVTPDGQKPVTVGKGDLVTFPEGMSCVWDVLKPVRKHYRFG
jgi:uncharacterized cupin superfamily protein